MNADELLETTRARLKSLPRPIAEFSVAHGIPLGTLHKFLYVPGRDIKVRTLAKILAGLESEGVNAQAKPERPSAA